MIANATFSRTATSPSDGGSVGQPNASARKCQDKRRLTPTIASFARRLMSNHSGAVLELVAKEPGGLTRQKERKIPGALSARD